MDAGVYRITNTETGRVYIGASVHANSRIVQHKRHLKFRRHTNRMLQADWEAWGSDAFHFEVVTLCESETDAYLAETALLTELKASGASLYNVRFQPHPRVHPGSKRPARTSLGFSLEAELYDAIRELIEVQVDRTGRGSLADWVRQACVEKLERESVALTPDTPEGTE